MEEIVKKLFTEKALLWFVFLLALATFIDWGKWIKRWEESPPPPTTAQYEEMKKQCNETVANAETAGKNYKAADLARDQKSLAPIWERMQKKDRGYSEVNKIKERLYSLAFTNYPDQTKPYPDPGHLRFLQEYNQASFEVGVSGNVKLTPIFKKLAAKFGSLYLWVILFTPLFWLTRTFCRGRSFFYDFMGRPDLLLFYSLLWPFGLAWYPLSPWVAWRRWRLKVEYRARYDEWWKYRNEIETLAQAPEERYRKALQNLAQIPIQKGRFAVMMGMLIATLATPFRNFAQEKTSLTKTVNEQVSQTEVLKPPETEIKFNGFLQVLGGYFEDPQRPISDFVIQRFMPIVTISRGEVKGVLEITLHRPTQLLNKAFIHYSPFGKILNFRAGLQPIPFINIDDPPFVLDVPDFPNPVFTICPPFHQVGISLNGQIGYLNYQVGAFNGNKEINDNNTAKDFAASLILDLKWFAWGIYGQLGKQPVETADKKKENRLFQYYGINLKVQAKPFTLKAAVMRKTEEQGSAVWGTYERLTIELSSFLSAAFQYDGTFLSEGGTKHGLATGLIILPANSLKLETFAYPLPEDQQRYLFQAQFDF